MDFKLLVLPSAAKDIQDNIDYYASLQPELDNKFDEEINSFLLSIQKNPFFQIRYANVRCLPLKIFPVMIHFIVDENHKTVYIRAVINTSKNSDTNWIK